MEQRTIARKINYAFKTRQDNLKTGFINLGGQNIHYAIAGEDKHPTLFFVHGSPDDWTRFKKFMVDHDLSRHYRMIAIDRPGFGKTPRGHLVDLKDQSRIISRFVRLVNNHQPIYAVGHSYGGAVVVQLQADDPSLFKGLVLLAAALDPAKEKSTTWMRILDRSPLQYFLPRRYRMSNKELICLKNDLEILSRQFHNITCPVWIMHGDKDTLVAISNVEYAKTKLSNAGSVNINMLPGAGHYITDERFGDVKELLGNLHRRR